MGTFLLTWNQKKWDAWGDYQKAINLTRNRQLYKSRWSCNTKKITIGDRVFLIRLGSEPRGIIASGIVTSGIYDSEHWDKEKRKNGITVRRVDINFDVVLDWSSEAILPINLLNTGTLGLQYWSSQTSGIEIKEAVINELEKVWSEIVKKRLNSTIIDNYYEDELNNSEQIDIIEGAKKQIVVNAYERNIEAREKCIEYYGDSCYICGFNASKVYGHDFEGKIHVHHVRPLKEIGEEYIVDPKKDLIPVCPNCHMILHSKGTTLTPEGVKKIILVAEAYGC